MGLAPAAAPPVSPAAPPTMPTEFEPVEPGAAGPPPLPLSEGPTTDPQLERSQGPARGASRVPPPATLGADPSRDPLPPARELRGQSAGLNVGEPQRASPHVLPPDSIPLGKQSFGLTVDVQSPQFLNIHQEATLKIVVRNAGQSDALGVSVRDELPETLDFVSSQPPCQQNDRLLSWNLGNVPAGSEQTIVVRVRPIKVGPFDHAATVTMLGGGRSRTIVREPRLKVEQTVSPVKVLKGQTVEFRIRVSNTGDGPARNVLVQAKLSAGLRHESGEPNDQNLFEQTLDRLDAGQHVDLDPLVTDTTAGGEQSCAVLAQSPDVVPATGGDEMKSTQSVQVVEPKLAMTISGPEKRYTDTEAMYAIAVENPGTAPARKVRVRATLPLSGRLVASSSGGHFDPGSRNLVWTLPQLDPGQKQTFTLRVRMGGVGLYRVNTEARGEGALLATADARTDVSGMADVDFDVIERRRVVDVDDVTTFQVKITNSGTKDATHILVKARYSDNIVPDANVTDGNEQVNYNPTQRLVMFPGIERLGPGKETTLTLRVKAVKPGLAKCNFFLMHDDLSEQESLEAMAAFRVPVSRRQ
jgi:uncharacterized repeat protein (TIGR01451 family)